jgi:hypothetical protein
MVCHKSLERKRLIILNWYLVLYDLTLLRLRK